ncbi:bleomycin resistance protein [Methylorubrum suomiense]|uniref:Bleomycin resistance protein n=1 Tax=Methylorubrum suomiense TaxID=144191 RepID=A0ABQ4UUY8_9HYPH|nr:MULTISPECIES: VOC family protein [Methylobacteriaceae]GJE76005.1 hypothetical protein BGCPKDLD_2596 [Methylorubrum suomiense]
MNDKGWAPLVPEFICENLARSQHFYCDLIGFSVRFARPEDGFVYLDLDGAQLMLEERHAECWITGPLHAPFGRGLNLQIEVADIAAILGRLEAAGIRPFREASEAWYRDGDIEHGQIEVLVQDPDGYLLRFVEVTGTRPASVIEDKHG